jgi:hypothetical protein
VAIRIEQAISLFHHLWPAETSRAISKMKSR